MPSYVSIHFMLCTLAVVVISHRLVDIGKRPFVFLKKKHQQWMRSLGLVSAYIMMFTCIYRLNCRPIYDCRVVSFTWAAELYHGEKSQPYTSAKLMQCFFSIWMMVSYKVTVKITLPFSSHRAHHFGDMKDFSTVMSLAKAFQWLPVVKLLTLHQ